MITYEQLAEIMPIGASERRIAQFLDPLRRGMEEFQINTPQRMAAFIANLAHESAEFRYVKEIASGEAYEGRKDLGNTQPGDGRRFRGRGLIQLTGRANYQKLSRHFGVDFVDKPALLETPEWAARSACWYWRHGNGDLNPLADNNSFQMIVRRINGGLNGLAARTMYWERARSVFAAEVGEIKPKSALVTKEQVATGVTTTVGVGTAIAKSQEISDAVSMATHTVTTAQTFWGAVSGFFQSPAVPWILFGLTAAALIFFAIQHFRSVRRGDTIVR